MSLCAFCGHPTGHPGGLCGHHSAGHGDDWACGNRLRCDLLHRGITSSRPHEVDRLEREGRTLTDELGDRAIFTRLDVTSDRDWAATVAAAEDAFGPVTVLVNNAAIVRFGTIAETEPAAWRQVIDINLTGTYLGIRAIVASMRKAGGGAIVNISAGAGMTAQFGLASYVSSKWAGRGLTKTAALELPRDKIRVNSIHPGAIRTPMVAGPDTAALAAAGGRGLAIPRIAEPEEITRLVLFVASDE